LKWLSFGFTSKNKLPTFSGHRQFFIYSAPFSNFQMAQIFKLAFSFSIASPNPSGFFPPVVAKKGCPPPPPLMALAASRMSCPALMPLSKSHRFT